MTRLEKRVLAAVAQASHEYGLLEPDDRVMVAVSGGKDSLSLLVLLREIQRKAPFGYSLVAVTLDQGQPQTPVQPLVDFFQREGFEWRVVREDIYSIVQDRVAPGKSPCSLCSRLRRAVLYRVASELGATKLALGHHRDDVVETLLLNILYSGQLKAMPPRLRSDDGRHVVIRPLVYCSEADLTAFAEVRCLPTLPCPACGMQENLQRQRIKRLVRELAAGNPHVPGNLLAALGNVRLSHLFDRTLRRRAGMDRDGRFDSVATTL